MGARNYFNPKFGLTMRINLTSLTDIKIEKIKKMIIKLLIFEKNNNDI